MCINHTLSVMSLQYQGIIDTPKETDGRLSQQHHTIYKIIEQWAVNNGRAFYGTYPDCTFIMHFRRCEAKIYLSKHTKQMLKYYIVWRRFADCPIRSIFSLRDYLSYDILPCFEATCDGEFSNRRNFCVMCNRKFSQDF